MPPDYFGLCYLFEKGRDGWSGKVAYPDGRPVLRQPCRLLRAFDVLQSEYAELTKQRGRGDKDGDQEDEAA